MYIHHGKALIEIEGSDGQIVPLEAQPGDSFRIPPLTKHRLEAIEDTTLFEVSTAELEDVERLKDDYGRTKPKGQTQGHDKPG